MTDRTPDERQARVARANHRAMTSLVALAVVVSVVTFASLAALLWQGQVVRDNQREIKSQGKQITKLLEAAKVDTDGRVAAVAKVISDNRASLAEHDRSVKDYLRKNFRLLDEEVNAPANQEAQEPVVVVRPPAVLRPGARGFIGPVPCKPIGKSGKCRG